MPAVCIQRVTVYMAKLVMSVKQLRYKCKLLAQIDTDARKCMQVNRANPMLNWQTQVQTVAMISQFIMQQPNCLKHTLPCQVQTQRNHVRSGVTCMTADKQY